MLTVFGDESTDEREQRVFAVAGVMGSQEEWDELEPVWVKRTKGRIFHASDCEAGRGDFKNDSHKENMELYADLVKLLTRTKMIGFAAVVDLKVHKEFFPDVVENIPYHFCFSEVVMFFGEMAYLSVPQQKVKFTFDINLRTRASAGELYEYLATTNDWKYAEYLDEISFAKRNNIGIQAADILAREAMKHHDNIIAGPGKYPPRKSMQEFCSTDRYKFLHYGRKYFTAAKINADQYMQERAGFTRDDYMHWLEKNRLVDNVGNRNKFLLHKPDRTKEKS